MCCSVSPNVEVRFSDTILYAAEVVDLQDKIVHVLGYQNRAQNNVNEFSESSNNFWSKLKSTFTSAEELTGNAMILPFPAVLGTMSKANVLDTKDCPKILRDIARAVTPPVPERISFGIQSARSAVVEIFEAAGIYTVVLAQDARLIPDALNQVPKEKRPKLNPALFDAYAKWYPDWTIALCCFNNDEAQEALPMLWWYEPMNPEELFLPALDCHSGNVPSLHESVLVDHTLAVGSSLIDTKMSVIKCQRCLTPVLDNNNFCGSCGYNLQRETATVGEYQRVFYQDLDSLTEIKPYLLPKVMGGVYKLQMLNGDFVCQIDKVRKGIWNPVRALPPNAH